MVALFERSLEPDFKRQRERERDFWWLAACASFAGLAKPVSPSMANLVMEFFTLAGLEDFQNALWWIFGLTCYKYFAIKACDLLVGR